MTIKQETIKKISLLSEKNIYVVLAMVDEMLRQENVIVEKRTDKKMQAYQEIIDLAKKNPVPKDFDFEHAREEALIEKYGSIN